MSPSSSTVPVHESLTVVEREDIYRNDEWWKAVVKYHYEDSDHDETAVYLWHKDDGEWTRKNKYVIKTVDAWTTDRQLIEALLDNDSPTTDNADFPVSDYYHVAAGVTVFQSTDWWKAILNIDEKGSYETDEVMVYLWQRREGEWRRRQKYTIKDWDSWEEERETIETVLGNTASDSTSPTASTARDAPEQATGSRLDMSEEVADLDAELEAHLSETLE